MDSVKTAAYIPHSSLFGLKYDNYRLQMWTEKYFNVDFQCLIGAY